MVQSQEVPQQTVARFVTTAEIRDAKSQEDLRAIAGERPLSIAARRLAAHRGMIEEDEE